MPTLNISGKQQKNIFYRYVTKNWLSRTPMRSNQQTAWTAKTSLFKSLSKGSRKQGDKSGMADRNPKEQEFNHYDETEAGRAGRDRDQSDRTVRMSRQMVYQSVLICLVLELSISYINRGHCSRDALLIKDIIDCLKFTVIL